jgi:hypothetical protein
MKPPRRSGSPSRHSHKSLSCEAVAPLDSFPGPPSSGCASEWQLTEISAFLVLSNCELLLENWRSSADPLPFQRDIYFNTVGDLDEGNAPVHAVVFAIEGHSAVDAPRG